MRAFCCVILPSPHCPLQLNCNQGVHHQCHLFTFLSVIPTLTNTLLPDYQSFFYLLLIFRLFSFSLFLPCKQYLLEGLSLSSFLAQSFLTLSNTLLPSNNFPYLLTTNVFSNLSLLTGFLSSFLSNLSFLSSQTSLFTLVLKPLKIVVFVSFWRCKGKWVCDNAQYFYIAFFIKGAEFWCKSRDCVRTQVSNQMEKSMLIGG